MQLTASRDTKWNVRVGDTEDKTSERRSAGGVGENGKIKSDSR